MTSSSLAEGEISKIELLKNLEDFLEFKSIANPDLLLIEIKSFGIDEGKRIITRIIKPQVNYKGQMIQTAQIEVTEA